MRAASRKIYEYWWHNNYKYSYHNSKPYNIDLLTDLKRRLGTVVKGYRNWTVSSSLVSGHLSYAGSATVDHIKRCQGRYESHPPGITWYDLTKKILPLDFHSRNIICLLVVTLKHISMLWKTGADWAYSSLAIRKAEHTAKLAWIDTSQSMFSHLITLAEHMAKPISHRY